MYINSKYISFDFCRKIFDINCPKCTYDKKVKSGIVKRKQRYKCRRCGYNYTVELNIDRQAEVNEKASLAYMPRRIEGCFTGRFFVSVLNRKRKPTGLQFKTSPVFFSKNIVD
jgi:rubredoxin